MTDLLSKMPRRNKIPFILLMAILLVSCGSLPSNKKNIDSNCYENLEALSTRDNPNIVFILTDDQDIDSLDYMPHVQSQLVKKGIVLKNYFINVPQCCPSRSTILLGQYSHNTGILRNGGDEGGFRTFFRLGREKCTIIAGLHSVGYRTILLGKYLNGYPGAIKKRQYIPPGWDEWVVPVTGEPYSQYSYKMNINGQVINFHDTPSDYLTDVLTEYTIEFIRKSAELDQPFFIFLAPYAPHAPATGAPRHNEWFSDLSASQDGSYNELDVTDKPEHIRIQPLFSTRDYSTINNLFIHRLRSLQPVDEMVDHVIDTLEEYDILDNTYIFYTSDNGFHLGQHRLAPGKLSPYEEDIHVPAVIRGPGIPPGTTRTEITGNIDIAATLAEIAGLNPANDFDGRSLLPILHGEVLAASDWRQAFLIQYWAGQTNATATYSYSIDGTIEPPDTDELYRSDDDISDIPPFQGLRIEKYVYVEYATGELELYDIIRDPYQLQNIVSTSNPDFLDQLSNWLDHLSKCEGINCRKADQAPDDLIDP